MLFYSKEVEYAVKIDLTQTHDVGDAYHSIDWKETQEKYNDPGTKYCFDVLDGKKQAGYNIQLACFRHLRDLHRQNTKEFPYHYDIKQVNRLLTLASIYFNFDTSETTKLIELVK